MHAWLDRLFDILSPQRAEIRQLRAALIERTARWLWYREHFHPGNTYPDSGYAILMDESKEIWRHRAREVLEEEGVL